MASIDRYRPPAREGYQLSTGIAHHTAPSQDYSNPRSASSSIRLSKSPSKRRDVPPAVPSPPTHTSRNSPPRPLSHRPRTPAAAMSTTPVAAVPDLAGPLGQWFFTEEEILSSPSILEGIPPAEERLRRAKGVNFIYQLGVLLELPQTTLYVAGIFFHRFYMRFPMEVEERRSNGSVERRGVHHYNIAATALFLANKTEENCRKTKEIICATAKVAQKNVKLQVDEQSKEYWRWRDSILMYEEVMLENLTFDLMVENPQQKLYDILGQLGIIHNKNLRHAAWAFCNDSCLTPLPLLMSARDIAIASVFFSSTFNNERIDDINGEAWWKLVHGNEATCNQAIRIASEFYRENPLRKTENPYSGSPKFELENTRRKNEESSADATPRTDRGTQSPRARANGTDGTGDHARNDDLSGSVESAAKSAPGDSDAALKEAANNPDIHQDTSADGPESPRVKRKGVESLAGEPGIEMVNPEEGRESKRRRLSSDGDDEGEVHE